MFYLVSGSLYFFCFVYVFFFKQKTAYEMRISDWSSDVCCSDPHFLFLNRQAPFLLQSAAQVFRHGPGALVQPGILQCHTGLAGRSEASRVGQACVSTRRSRWPL